ncbi:MAG TPA: TlpA family protein disulfide reductase [Nitrospirae bacterium]|nr:thiol-disulfide oxidoreductase ResA [bacterium BMS3Abin09]GBE41341.1 thiol-disulfide oxidoreductase ResA [bacterium BMS3Bbin09]HDH34577.1 TlpA family protein disulfide reductase [Nitrospirota bacterium]HDN94589.1 TlpA family protein disulfide reductase [Nitrospirota bacterium]HDO67599.1 TlpA family protein disulfide reductase [Nitrospirota bacterium]
MKYKGPVLLILIAIAIATLFLIPETKVYKEIASVDQPAPDFEYADSTGKIWKLADLKGKVVLVNFWATWCATCKAEMPQKELLYRKMEGRPFQMLGMLFRDDPDNLPDYFKQNKVSFPTLISPDNDSAKRFGITGVPETFIIDKDGVVREKLVGPQEWNSEESLAIIEKYL